MNPKQVWLQTASQVGEGGGVGFEEVEVLHCCCTELGSASGLYGSCNLVMVQPFYLCVCVCERNSHQIISFQSHVGGLYLLMDNFKCVCTRICA